MGNCCLFFVVVVVVFDFFFIVFIFGAHFGGIIACQTASMSDGIIEFAHLSKSNGYVSTVYTLAS